MRIVTALVVAVGLLAVSLPPVAAQSYQGGLRGAVRDASGVLPGAELTLINEDTTLKRTTVTNDVGEFAFTGEREEDRHLPFGSPFAAELCALGRAYYADRRERPREDVLSLIANATIDGCPLSGRDLDNTFAILVVAGNETTRQAIASGLLAFARNPNQWRLLRSDPSLLQGAVEEVLRYAHPVWHFRRTATRDAELRGTTIRAGDKVVVWFAAANRDADVFPDPHSFDITREPNEHATFGRVGPHFCLGAWLARLELKVLLEELIPRVETFELAGEPQRLRSNFTNGLKRLPLRVRLAPM